MGAAYIEAVRVVFSRISGPRKLSFNEINEQINEMLNQSISEGVINLFSDKNEEVSFFDPAFFEKIGMMKEKNLAANY